MKVSLPRSTRALPLVLTSAVPTWSIRCSYTRLDIIWPSLIQIRGHVSDLYQQPLEPRYSPTVSARYKLKPEARGSKDRFITPPFSDEPVRLPYTKAGSKFKRLVESGSDPVSLFAAHVAQGKASLQVAKQAMVGLWLSLPSDDIERALSWVVTCKLGANIVNWLNASGQCQEMLFLKKHDFLILLVRLLEMEGLEDIVHGWLDVGKTFPITAADREEWENLKLKLVRKREPPWRISAIEQLFHRSWQELAMSHLIESKAAREDLDGVLNLWFRLSDRHHRLLNKHLPTLSMTAPLIALQTAICQSPCPHGIDGDRFDRLLRTLYQNSERGWIETGAKIEMHHLSKPNAMPFVAVLKDRYCARRYSTASPGLKAAMRAQCRFATSLLRAQGHESLACWIEEDGIRPFSIDKIRGT